MFFMDKKINAIEFIQLFSHLILKLCIDAELSSYPSIALYRIRHLSCKKQVSGGHAGNEELMGALPNTLIEKITIGEPQDEEGIQEVRIY